MEDVPNSFPSIHRARGCIETPGLEASRSSSGEPMRRGGMGGSSWRGGSWRRVLRAEVLRGRGGGVRTTWEEDMAEGEDVGWRGEEDGRRAVLISVRRSNAGVGLAPSRQSLPHKEGPNRTSATLPLWE